jgi:hypothetical protein
MFEKAKEEIKEVKEDVREEVKSISDMATEKAGREMDLAHAEYKRVAAELAKWEAEIKWLFSK